MKHSLPIRGSTAPASGVVETTSHPSRIVSRLLRSRSRDGSLLSIRIPVTRANRRLLRAVRSAELAAWEAVDPTGRLI